MNGVREHPGAARATAVDAATAAALLRAVLGAGAAVDPGPGRLEYSQWSLSEDNISVIRVTSRGTAIRFGLEQTPGLLCVRGVMGRIRLRGADATVDIEPGDCVLVPIDGASELEWEEARFELIALAPGVVRRLLGPSEEPPHLHAGRITPANRALAVLWTRLAGIAVDNLLVTEELSERPVLRDALLDALTVATLEAFDVAEEITVADDSDARVLDRAEQYMSTRLNEALRVSDVARAVGLSARRLQMIYRRQGTEGPNAHLRRLRMEAAHQALAAAAPGTQVSTVARRLGYTNVGRFGAHYHSAYGEYPSAVLRRGSGAAYEAARERAIR